VVARDRVLFVVAEHHRPYWQQELSDVGPENVLVQPSNRGTAGGVLLAAIHVLFHRDPKARLLLLPSDHHVGDEEVLRDALTHVVQTRMPRHRRILLMGITPEACDPDYGWILPAGERHTAPVAQFVEKPNVEGAMGLMRRGALINSFMIVAHASALVRACEQTVPDVVRAFVDREERGAAAPSLTEFYAGLPTADLSRDVLTRSTPSLAVVRIPPCGWSDLGTPARLSAYQCQHAPQTHAPSAATGANPEIRLAATA
jgi:mannose-1-phosphate guanylyltransferase